MTKNDSGIQKGSKGNAPTKRSRNKKIASQTVEELILNFDILHSTPEEAKNFVAWLQVELMNGE